VRDLRRAALLHDVGKLAISNQILDKAAGLNAAEAAIVREHPVVTGEILERVPCFRRLAPLACAHHERLDGRGYPRGLMAAELDLPMRVLAVADVYEAVTSERPYRMAMSSSQALAILRAEAPAKLDATAVAALEELLDERFPFDGRLRAERVLGEQRAG
jgi:HD-GYP domain-containing protein (c-di-GMP phosphodiesterase class II)